MKKLISIFLTITLILSMLSFAAAANQPAEDDIKTILDVMNIMTYDAKGNFNEGTAVTRAALAKILVNSSKYKGVATASSRISPFADVLFTHWGAPYISVASKNKFMTGYSDGTFRPDKNVLYEEVLSAMLRLLGYTNDDYTGAYPAGQLAKADDIGLSENVFAYQGSPLTRSEMAKLVYNLLNTPAKGESSIYATKLGYTPSSELLTIGDVFKDNVIGPVTVKPGILSSLAFSESSRVYKDGSSSKLSEIENYDIIYYSKQSNSVWAYSKKVSGIVTEISPNKESPTSVTVSGVKYPLNYYSIQRAFGLDGLKNGDTVTMLLDKNGNVCDAYRANELYESIIGVMTGVSQKTITSSDGTKVTGYYAEILTLDGSYIEVPQTTSSDSYVGKAVSFNPSTNQIRSYISASSSVSGYINSDAYLIGNTSIAKNIKIVEIDDNGNMISPTLSRLNGVRLESDSVLLSSRNSSGAVDGLILKDVTGDMHKYGIITDIKKNSFTDKNGNVSQSSIIYSYDLAGVRGTISFTNGSTTLSKGPCVFMYKNGELTKAKNLILANNVSLLTPESATLESGMKHKISPNVVVYRVVGDDKLLTTLDEAISHEGTVWVYYDDIQSAGGLVRVIYIK